MNSNEKKIEKIKKELETEKKKNKILQKLVTELKNKPICQELTHIRKDILKTASTPPTPISIVIDNIRSKGYPWETLKGPSTGN